MQTVFTKLAFRKYFIPGKLDNRVWGVVEDDSKNLWFASYGKGLTKFDGKDFKRIESYKSQLNTDTFYIGNIKKSNGNLLFSTTKGVLQFDGKQFLKVPHLPDQIYLHIFEDVDNQTIIYAGENSLVFATKDTVKVFDNLKFHLPQIFNIIKDHNNIYRMGDSESTVFYDYKTCKPILTDEIGEAVLDLKSYFGKIYFGTIKGVGLIDLDRFYKNEKAVSYFDYKNGYQGEEVVQNGAIINSDSSIWIPSTRGVIKFVPSKIETINHLPQIQLESLIVYNRKGGKTSISGFELNKMNPHFVFNCISSINALINPGDKQEAPLYSGRFATLLRSVLKSVRANEISLEDELIMIENYMKLEQTRYSNPFNYTINRPEGISPALIIIPPLIIQPFI